MKHLCRFIFTLGFTSALAGCVTVHSSSNQLGQPSPPPEPEVTADAGDGHNEPLVAIEVYAVPVALNWDSDPQPDGVELEIYFFAAKTALALPVSRGIVTVRAYDGRPDKQAMATRRPLHAWHLTPAILARHQHRGMVGVGYDLPLDWGRDVPRNDYVTMTVQYHSAPKTAPIDAAPVVIAVKTGSPPASPTTKTTTITTHIHKAAKP